MIEFYTPQQIDKAFDDIMDDAIGKDGLSNPNKTLICQITMGFKEYFKSIEPYVIDEQTGEILQKGVMP